MMLDQQARQRCTMIFDLLVIRVHDDIYAVLEH